MADLREYLSVDYWRDHLLTAAYIGWGFILFLVFMIGSFPYQDAMSSLLGPMGLKLSYQEQRMRFPIGTALENVRLASTSEDGAPLFQSPSVRLAPSAGILLGRPALRINADVYNGTVKATVTRSGSDTIAIDFDSQDLNLAQSHALAKYGASLVGLLSASGSLKFADTVTNDDGTIEISGKDVALRPGAGFPPITLTTLKGKAKIEHGILQIEQLEGNGPDLKLALHGSIRLMQELTFSTLALSLDLQPTPQGRSRLGFLLALLPHPPTSRPYTLRGSLMAPSIS